MTDTKQPTHINERVPEHLRGGLQRCVWCHNEIETDHEQRVQNGFKSISNLARQGRFPGAKNRETVCGSVEGHALTDVSRYRPARGLRRSLMGAEGVFRRPKPSRYSSPARTALFTNTGQAPRGRDRAIPSPLIFPVPFAGLKAKGQERHVQFQAVPAPDRSPRSSNLLHNFRDAVLWAPLREFGPRGRCADSPAPSLPKVSAGVSSSPKEALRASKSEGDRSPALRSATALSPSQLSFLLYSYTFSGLRHDKDFAADTVRLQIVRPVRENRDALRPNGQVMGASRPESSPLPDMCRARGHGEPSLPQKNLRARAGGAAQTMTTAPHGLEELARRTK